MATPLNRHRVNCIGAMSFPTESVQSRDSETVVTDSQYT